MAALFSDEVMERAMQWIDNLSQIDFGPAKIHEMKELLSRCVGDMEESRDTMLRESYRGRLLPQWLSQDVMTEDRTHDPPRTGGSDLDHSAIPTCLNAFCN